MAVELGVAYVSMLPDTAKFVPAMKNTFSSVDGAADASGKSIGGIMFGAVAGVGMALMNKAIGTITNSFGAAISRVDTLNAFPKVMQNLGYSADDAQASIAKMSDKLVGLPTSLSDMAGAVQVMAPLTSSLGEATDISLALNNALIAGGKSTAEQSNAMQQYTQMLSVGAVDMAAWRSMVSAMPGQMDQLAKSLLGADAKQTDLYQAMKDGTVTFDDFNAELLKLNDSGLEGFASFQQQAQDATGGIGTSLANLQTAITRNLANVLDRLKPQIDSVVSGLTGFANAAGPAFVSVIDGIASAAQWAGDNWGWLGPLLVGVGALVGVFGAWTGAIALWTKITTLAKAVQLAFNTAILANPIGAIVAVIAAVVAALVYFFTQTELGKQVWANFTQFLSEAWTNITTWFTGFAATFSALWNSLWSNIGTFLSDTWANIKAFFATALQFVVDMFLNWTVYGLIIKHWDEISAFFTNLWTAIKAVFFAAVSWVTSAITGFVTGVQAVWNAAWSAVSSFFTTIWNNIVNAAVGFVAATRANFQNVMDFIKSVPSKILGFFTGIGTWLLDSGRSLIQGFLDGIMAGFNKAKDFVADGLGKIRDLFPFSPAKEGPFSGRGWVAYSGLSIGETFTDSIVRGISDGRSDVSRALAGVQGQFSDVARSGMQLSASVASGYASNGLDVAGVVQNNTFNSVDANPLVLVRHVGREMRGLLV